MPPHSKIRVFDEFMVEFREDPAEYPHTETNFLEMFTNLEPGQLEIIHREPLGESQCTDICQKSRRNFSIDPHKNC